MLVTVLCIVNLTACGSSEESKPSVYSVGDVLNFSNSNGEEYSVCITDWGTSVDGSILDIFSLKTVTDCIIRKRRLLNLWHVERQFFIDVLIYRIFALGMNSILCRQ